MFNVINIRYLYNLSLFLLFAQMAVLPANHSELKAPFVFLILFIYLVNSCFFRFKVKYYVVYWFISYMTYGLVWGLIGMLDGNQYAIDFIRVQVLWPMVYLIMIQGMAIYGSMKYFEDVLFFIALLIFLYNINFLLFHFGLPSVEILTGWDEYEEFGWHNGFTQMNNQNISTLVFIAPYIFSTVIMKGSLLKNKVKIAIVVLTFFNIILSGRRAILFVFFMSLPFTLILNEALYKKRWVHLFSNLIKYSAVSTAFLYIVVLFAFIIFDLDIGGFIDRITFSGDQEDGKNYRIDMSLYYLNDALEHNIIIGRGGGGEPFEIRYVKLIHESGILGLIFYCTLITMPLYKSYEAIKKSDSLRRTGIPIIVGYLCFLLGEMTNPYSGSFDYMWMLFMPLAFINCYEK